MHDVLGSLPSDFLVAAVSFALGVLVTIVWLWRRAAVIRGEVALQQRAVLKGQIAEQLAPYFPAFPFRPSEARFLGKPVDFIVFEGLDDEVVRRVIFVEVKSGKSRLTKAERSLQECLDARRVSYEVFRIAE
jgi:predicted Holliday junction resolvase-like endonuclease